MHSSKMAKTIGERIKKLRRPDETKPPVYTQEKLGELLGVSGNTVDKWEHNRSSPSAEMVASIAKVFGITCDYVIAENETINITLIEELGLSNASIERLKSKQSKMTGIEAKAINLLLSPQYRGLLSSIYMYLFPNYKKPYVKTTNGMQQEFPPMVFPPLIPSDEEPIAYSIGDPIDLLLNCEEPNEVLDRAMLLRLMNEFSNAKEKVYENSASIKMSFERG